MGSRQVWSFSKKRRRHADMDRLTWKRKLVDGGDAEFQRAVVLVAVLGDCQAPVDWLQPEYHEALVARLEESYGEAVACVNVALFVPAVFTDF